MDIESKFGRERHKLLEEVKEEVPGPKAMQKLAHVRREYDCAISDYLNTLSILSDTTYQDRKHFLLELIQNADDAQFSKDEAVLTFSIFEDSIELRYNENGFDVEDVIAITGAGASTKTGKKRLSHSFIGEKGIGFKSVFALASKVEIESPPWHFLLRKEKCIVPEIVNTGAMKAGDGTRLRVVFSDSGVVTAVATELDRYSSGEVESLLFLQRLSCFKVEDHRCDPPKIQGVSLSPADRSGDVLTLKTFPDGRAREYLLYARDEEFPANLVAERWERVGSEIGALKRKMIVAAILDTNEQRMPEGGVFCFLPTKIKLPVPLFIQVDGHTKADRERLHDPEQNSWNKHLLSLLPQFLLEAILAWRGVPAIAERLPVYIPTNEGTDQLAPVFSTLMRRLRGSRWVSTLDEEDGWVSPDRAIVADGFLSHWLAIDAQFREQAERILNKKFVHPDWSAKKDYKEKLTLYGVGRLDESQIVSILLHAPIPKDMLSNEENLLGLYREILKLPSFSSRSSLGVTQQIRERLCRAPIYPLEGGRFGALSTGDTDKVFWLSVRARRDTGLGGGLEHRIVDPEYTYRAEPGGDASAERITECRRINDRNEIVKDLLKRLNIHELTDESILSDLQIPWLINSAINSPADHEAKLNVLSSIFEAYKAKRQHDDDYLAQLSRIAGATFHSEDGRPEKLRDLLLPEVLRLKPEDEFYAETGLPALSLPDRLLGTHGSGQRQITVDKEREKQEKLRSEWRKFLVHCGIKIAPSFVRWKTVFETVHSFEYKDEIRYKKWAAEISRYYTAGNPVTLYTVELDRGTRLVIESNARAPEEISAAIHKSFLSEYGASLSTVQDKYRSSRQMPGTCISEYKCYTDRQRSFPDYLWAGILREKIPLVTLTGAIATPKEAVSVPDQISEKVPRTSLHLPLVKASTGEGQSYHPVFLDTLAIRPLSISHVNPLWGIIGKTSPHEVLQVAIELLELGIAGREALQVFDKEFGRLRPAADFQLGKEGMKGIPLIEVQYGKLGRRLGELLELRTADDADDYVGLLGRILKEHSNGAQTKHEPKLYELLSRWQHWDALRRGRIAIDFHEAISVYPDAPVFIVNNQELANQLRNTGRVAIHVNASEPERYWLEIAAKDLGLTLPSEAGGLSISGQKPLSELELTRFQLLVDAYLGSLEPIELSRLRSKLSHIGDLPSFAHRIVKVEDAARIIGQSYRVEVPLPYHDEKQQQLLVSLEDRPETILAHLLSLCEFTRYRSALAELREIASSIGVRPTQTVLVPVDGREADGQELGKPASDSRDSVAQAVRDGLRRDKGDSIGDDRGWNTGLDPEEEERLRQKLGPSLVESLNAGPELHERKVRRQAQKASGASPDHEREVVDPGAVDPKAFLLAEYNGKCQICGTELQLNNGRKWIEVFRIRELHEGIWWCDRPFNILGLCPNCHALSRHGGRDFENINRIAQEVIEGTAFPEEVAEFKSDLYIVPVKVNGRVQELKLSKMHMNHFAVLFQEE